MGITSTVVGIVMLTGSLMEVNPKGTPTGSDRDLIVPIPTPEDGTRRRSKEISFKINGYNNVVV